MSRMEDLWREICLRESVRHFVVSRAQPGRFVLCPRGTGLVSPVSAILAQKFSPPLGLHHLLLSSLGIAASCY